MDHRTGTPAARALAWLLALCAIAPAWKAGSQGTGPVEVESSAVLDFAADVLERPSGRRGALEVLATLVSGTEVEGAEGSLEVALDAAVAIEPGWTSGRRLRVTVLAYDLDDDPTVLEEEVEIGAPGRAAWWLYRRAVRLPADFIEAVVVVEDLDGGGQGGTRVGYGRSLDLPAVRRSGVLVDTLPQVAQPLEQGPPRRAVVRLVPPRGAELTGEVRLRTILTTDDVARVSFLLDGTEVAVDDREPFAADIDLGPEPRSREVVAVAYSAGGRELGRDRVLLNRRLELFDVRLGLEPAEPGSDELIVAAEVTVPRERSLDRVELYRNESLLETRKVPPFRFSMREGELGRDDYLRVVAHLVDGTSLDDVWLVADAEASARINVNLVQVFAVASNRRGEPLTDLVRDDFDVRVGRRRVEIERFERATDVPLSLGLVFDTSGSMWALMPDALQAGGRFLDSIVRPGDRAFLVDFDTRPRLAHGLTGDVGSLLRRFATLEAEGSTALYDAVVFALLQFDDAPGRRAVVVLTDGVPEGGEFSARQCIRHAREKAVPIYSIDLSGVLGRPMGAKLPLVGLAKATGGRVHTIHGDPSALDGYQGIGRALEHAYDEIDRELRSQYVMAFSTPEPLTARELESVEVEVRRPGVKVRQVVGTSTG